MGPRFVYDESIFDKHPEVTKALIESIIRSPEQRRAVSSRKPGKPAFMVCGRDKAGVLYEVGYRIEVDVEGMPVFVWHAMRSGGRSYARVVEKTAREETGRANAQRVEELLREVEADRKRSSGKAPRRRRRKKT